MAAQPQQAPAPGPAPAQEDLDRVKTLRLKELLGAWNARIAEQRAAFGASAERVRAWDAHLRASMIDLHHLEAGVADLEQTCHLMEVSLTDMESTQANIGSKLRALEEKMERQLPRLPHTNSATDPASTYQGAAQLARAQAYDAAIELGGLLDHLETALDDVEERVRAGQMADSMHPLAQLRQIMYENLRGLQQVQHGSEGLMGQSREIREQLGALSSSGR